MLLGLLLIPLVGILLVSLLPTRFTAGVGVCDFFCEFSWGIWGFSQSTAMPITGWIFPVLPDLGIGFGLWADKVGWIFILLTLLFFVLLAFWHMPERPMPNAKFFWNCILFLQLSVLGLFSVGDMVMFYLLWK